MNAQPKPGLAHVPRGAGFTMRLADIVSGLKKGGRKSGLTPEREAILREVMEREDRYSCKALAAQWHVVPSTVESWRQIVRKRMVNK